ncbi:periodic tryptophan protein 2-like [Olea europaea var. sylvestris]|uniref:periodic tryptophan protein 2-like n=1 Tax=Olea europaea var. sylvestris TaxID=158386 RepID=UPI000C1CFBB0|nr:periodic tryptophan protein 2-like [Olea europaea var. sylvestris]
MFSLHKMKWELLKKDFFMQAPAKLIACDYHRGLDMVVVGFSNGVFGLYQMPDFVCIHLLSISREKISTVVFNDLGNWLTFGCAKLGQLLVWEWKSESYILKQQGHYFDVNSIAYSPDSQFLATGADDNKIKQGKKRKAQEEDYPFAFVLLHTVQRGVLHAWGCKSL